MHFADFWGSTSLISTSAFYLESDVPGSVTVQGAGAAAYVIPAGPSGEIRLFARSLTNAVIVHVSSGSSGREGTLYLAQRFAADALKNLEAATESLHAEVNTARPGSRNPKAQPDD